ncbi:MAG TPA: hypothetical protein DHV28_05945 [Ignavibacteriales bacterium]|nr:hypothetical protein [Ignavibacteriales bacterium]
MKKIIVIFVLAFSIIVIFSSTNGGSQKYNSTYCEQTFKLFFLTKGYKTFWIGENLSGECQTSTLLNISIFDSNATLAKTSMKNYNSWNEIKILSDAFDTYEAPITNNLSVSDPLFDSTLAKSFSSYVLEGGDNAIKWNAINGENGMVLPIVENFEFDLLFYYNAGLYINYKISVVQYYPDADIAIVFTEQPVRTIGMDTMHGFLIFKVKSI